MDDIKHEFFEILNDPENKETAYNTAFLLLKGDTGKTTEFLVKLLQEYVESGEIKSLPKKFKLESVWEEDFKEFFDGRLKVPDNFPIKKVKVAKDFRALNTAWYNAVKPSMSYLPNFTNGVKHNKDGSICITNKVLLATTYNYDSYVDMLVDKDFNHLDYIYPNTKDVFPTENLIQSGKIDLVELYSKLIYMQAANKLTKDVFSYVNYSIEGDISFVLDINQLLLGVKLLLLSGTKMAYIEKKKDSFDTSIVLRDVQNKENSLLIMPVLDRVYTDPIVVLWEPEVFPTA